jgi:hypothetical protein
MMGMLKDPLGETLNSYLTRPMIRLSAPLPVGFQPTLMADAILASEGIQDGISRHFFSSRSPTVDPRFSE